ncbi:hypothetical protein ACA910_018598 [Epithemia clementina (nom. ined.)]
MGSGNADDDGDDQRNGTTRVEKKLIVAFVGGTSEPHKPVLESNSDPHVVLAAAATAPSPPAVGQRQECRSIGLHQRKDPCTGRTRLYAVLEGGKKKCRPTQKKDDNSSTATDTTVSSEPSAPPTVSRRLCEVQMLPARAEDDEVSYSSFFIQAASSESAATVIGNGKLYLLTPMDPLFFLLPNDDEAMGVNENQPSSTYDDDNKKNNKNKSSGIRLQWQPLDQILSATDPILKSCLDLSQVLHLFATLKLGPDETFYRFSPQRALTWLVRKMETLQTFLEHQQQQQAKTEQALSSNDSTSFSLSGAFAEGFYNPSAGVQTKNEKASSSSGVKDDKIAQQRQRAKEQSIQILCNYLSESWSTRFLDHIQEAPSVLLSTKQRAAAAAKRSQSEMASSSLASSSSYNNNNNTDWMQAQSQQSQPLLENKKAKKETPMSASVKKLATVNTKGMKKMTAFFTSVPSTSSKTKKKR